MPSKREIIFVTGNANKLREVQQLLASHNNSHVIVNEPIDLLEIQGSDLNQIALTKCKQAVSTLGTAKPLFVEDTALCFNALNGLPGAYIKWFLQLVSLDDLVRMLEGFEDKSAKAVTTIAFFDPNSGFHVFQGITNGVIVPTRGSTNFGWDSIFQPAEGNETYAEMDSAAKNAISHRAKAFTEFKRHLNFL